MKLRKPCHECGSTKFGSYQASPTDVHRICYGYIDGVPCAVQWHERDDEKHFHTEVVGDSNNNNGAVATSKKAKIRVSREEGYVEVRLRDGVSLDEQILLTEAEAEKLARKLAKAGFRGKAPRAKGCPQDVPNFEGQVGQQVNEFCARWGGLYRQGRVRWNIGMLTVHGGRVVNLTERLALISYTSPEPRLVWDNPAHTYPDPTDAVTAMVVRDIWLGALGFRWKVGAGMLSKCGRSELDLTRYWPGNSALDYLNGIADFYQKRPKPAGQQGV